METDRKARADAYRKKLRKSIDKAESFGDKAAKKALELTKQCRSEVAAELVSVPKKKWKTAYLNRILADLDKTVDKYEKQLGIALEDYAVKAGEQGREVALGAVPSDWPGYAGVSKNIPIIVRGISADLVVGLSQDVRSFISHEVRIGLIRGDSPWDVMQRLGPSITTDGTKFKSVAYRAELIARTEMATSQSMVSLDSIRSAQKIDTGVKTIWIANIGACDECAALDGQVFDKGEEEVPPIHPNGRCSIAAYKKEWI